MPQGQYPQILAGQDGVASLLQAFAPLNAYKAVDTSRASFTTLTADPDLSIPVAANAEYYWQCFLDYEGGTQGSSDLKLQWSVPSGTGAHFMALGISTSGSPVALGIRLVSSAGAFGTSGAGTLWGLMMWGRLTTAATTGSFTLTWCQNTSSATPTIVHTGSSLLLARLA
jgi:hypothetical protein